MFLFFSFFLNIKSYIFVIITIFIFVFLNIQLLINSRCNKVLKKPKSKGNKSKHKLIFFINSPNIRVELNNYYYHKYNITLNWHII